MLDGSWFMAQGSWLMAKGGQGWIMADGQGAARPWGVSGARGGTWTGSAHVGPQGRAGTWG